jgi:hypothetical protein
MAIIRSIIQDMRSRSERAVQDRAVEAVSDGLSQSCWANMPQELLREVLVRIEASESAWPPRKSVAACAGVCRSWREITREIVKAPEVSGKLTFPISVKQVMEICDILELELEAGIWILCQFGWFYELIGLEWELGLLKTISIKFCRWACFGFSLLDL